MKKLFSILSILIVTISISACSGDDAQWQATVYNAQADAGKVIGTYESRAACEEASIMHFDKDKNKARAMMDQRGMSSSCSMVR